MKKKIFSFVLALMVSLSVIPVSVRAEGTGTWDGTTQTAPKAVGGVYQIGTAEELAWFAKKTQGSTTHGISGKLTADIDLNDQNWEGYEMGGTIPSLAGYSGTFDGDGHTISGFYYKNKAAIRTDRTTSMGLFGYVTGANVKNLTVDGQLVVDMQYQTASMSRYYAGGVIGSAKGSNIDHIINDVDITVENDPNSYAKGNAAGVVVYSSYYSDNSNITDTVISNCENRGTITGGSATGGVFESTGSNVTVKNCINTGNVTSLYGQAGGITCYGAGTTIEDSANLATISGLKGAGGIAYKFEYSYSTSAERSGSWAGIIRNCYNAGTINGGASSDYVAGIAAKNSGSTSSIISPAISIEIENCYNVGTINCEATGSSVYVGAIGGYHTQIVTATNLYYLDTSASAGIKSGFRASKTAAVAKTEEELKSADILAALGDGFKKDLGKINNGYPVLAWQTSEGPDEPDVPVTEAYTISAGEDSKINIGEDATVTLTVTNDNETAYNAYFINVAYDAAKLAYKAINTDATVKDENGTLTIAGYGDDKTCGTDNLVLTFTGKASGDAEVSVTAAKIDKSESATVHDAPDATIAAASKVTVSVGGYQVTLDENFEGESTVMPGADYTFTAKDPHYDYTFDAKMGEDAVTPTDNGDGTFTIKNVTGNLNIKAASKTPKTYTVTVEGDGKADVTAANSATYGTDYSFKLTKDDKYIYEVTVTVGGDVLQPTVSEDRSTYTIAGSDVTGNIIISVSKEAKPVETTEITFTGTGSADVKGGTTQNAENGKDFLFEINADENYEYTVTLGDETLTANDEGKYTIPAAKITGTALTVKVEKTEKSALTVDVSKYIELNGKNMWLVKAAGTVSEGKVLAYDGSAMFWSEKYNAYSFLVVSTNTEEQMKTEAAGKIAEADAEKTELAYNFDVNLSGQVDINDAQLTYDMYNAKYEDFDTVSMHKFLEADVNGDGIVNVQDSTAVVTEILK